MLATTRLQEKLIMSEEGTKKEGGGRRGGGRRGGPKPETPPVPDSMKGSTQTGDIDEVVKTKYGGPPRFGFIFIGEGEARPRIYFNLTDFTDEKFRARRDNNAKMDFCGVNVSPKFSPSFASPLLKRA